MMQPKIKKLNHWTHQHPLIMKTVKVAGIVFSFWALIRFPLPTVTLGFCAVLWIVTRGKLASISSVSEKILNCKNLSKLEVVTPHPSSVNSSSLALIVHPYYKFKHLNLIHLLLADEKNFRHLFPDPHQSSDFLLTPHSFQVEKHKGMDKGKRISYTFKDGETIYGEEIIERRNAVEDLRRNLKKQINILKVNLDEVQQQFDINRSPELLKKIQDIKFEIKLCQKSLENTQQISEDFIKSSFYRTELKKVIAQGSDYSTLINKICLGAPVNFRYHQCVMTHKKVGFFRLGAVTDPRNGFTNLKELKELAKNPLLLEKKLQELGKPFCELRKEFKKNYAKVAAYEYALAQLEHKNIEATIKERRHILANQILQLIQGQVEANFKSLSSSTKQQIFHLAHLGLLNRTTNQMDSSTGWVHCEANAMADMNEIFEDFSGKKLIFDGKGPCIDMNGHVHLPYLLQDEAGNIRTMFLETHFINISVQGHNKNDGIQQEINQKNMPRLIRIAQQQVRAHPNNKEFRDGLDLLLNVQKKLTEGLSDYQLAEDLCVALLKLDIPLSEGCLSVKDRGGYVGARTAFRFISENMDRHPELRARPKTLDKLKRKFSADLLNPKACAAQVVADNTKANILKCSSFNLPGYSDGIQGCARRLGYYIKQATVAPALISRMKA
jgi:hypothetical protein